MISTGIALTGSGRAIDLQGNADVQTDVNCIMCVYVLFASSIGLQECLILDKLRYMPIAICSNSRKGFY